MSSTSRGGKRSASDFYSTPSWPIHRLLERLPLRAGNWMESSAGEGAIIKAVNDYCRNCRPGFISWTAFELREECRPALEALGIENLTTGCDFLDPRIQAPSTKFDVSINNVPFGIAQEMIEKTLDFATDVLHLLRLNYLGSEIRNSFFKNNMPDIYVIPDRVSFALSVSCVRKKAKLCDYAEILPLDAIPPKTCPKCEAPTTVSSSDSIEYAWYHWGPERNRKKGEIHVLDHTPVEWRKVQPKVKAA